MAAGKGIGGFGTVDCCFVHGVAVVQRLGPKTRTSQFSDCREPRRRARVVDQRLQVGTHRAELRGADVEGLPRSRRVLAGSHDRVDEVFDCQELVAVVTLAERVCYGLARIRKTLFAYQFVVELQTAPHLLDLPVT